MCDLAVAGLGLGDIRTADERRQSDRYDPASRAVAAALRALSSDASRRNGKGTSTLFIAYPSHRHSLDLL